MVWKILLKGSAFPEMSGVITIEVGLNIHAVDIFSLGCSCYMDDLFVAYPGISVEHGNLSCRHNEIRSIIIMLSAFNFFFLMVLLLVLQVGYRTEF